MFITNPQPVVGFERAWVDRNRHLPMTLRMVHELSADNSGVIVLEEPFMSRSGEPLNGWTSPTLEALDSIGIPFPQQLQNSVEMPFQSSAGRRMRETVTVHYSTDERQTNPVETLATSSQKVVNELLKTLVSESGLSDFQLNLLSTYYALSDASTMERQTAYPMLRRMNAPFLPDEIQQAILSGWVVNVPQPTGP